MYKFDFWIVKKKKRGKNSQNTNQLRKKHIYEEMLYFGTYLILP